MTPLEIVVKKLNFVSVKQFLDNECSTLEYK